MDALTLRKMGIQLVPKRGIREPITKLKHNTEGRTTGLKYTTHTTSPSTLNKIKTEEPTYPMDEGTHIPPETKPPYAPINEAPLTPTYTPPQSVTVLKKPRQARESTDQHGPIHGEDTRHPNETQPQSTDTHRPHQPATHPLDRETPETHDLTVERTYITSDPITEQQHLGTHTLEQNDNAAGNYPVMWVYKNPHYDHTPNSREPKWIQTQPPNHLIIKSNQARLIQPYPDTRDTPPYQGETGSLSNPLVDSQTPPSKGGFGHHTPSIYFCLLCNRRYSTENNLKRHINEKHRPFVCDRCKTRFSSREDLNRHNTEEVLKHRLIDQLYTIWNSTVTEGSTEGQQQASADRPLAQPFMRKRKIYKCHLCTKDSQGKSNLKKHIRLVHTHKGVKPYICPYCTKASSLRENCTRHIRTLHPGKEVTVIHADQPNKGDHDTLDILRKLNKPQPTDSAGVTTKTFSELPYDLGEPANKKHKMEETPMINTPT